MDVRLSAEQRALRDSAAQLVGALAPGSVRELDDPQRAAQLYAAVSAAGWRELRTDDGDDQALASAVETALIAQELARGLADTSFLGPTLAAELRRLAGAPPAPAPETVALVPGLSQLATVPGPGRPADLVAIDAAGCTAALLLVAGRAGYRLARVDLPQATVHVDLTRSMSVVSSADAAPLPGQRRPLTPESVVRWTAFAIAMTCADLVGTMRGAVQLGCEYARIRRQFGVPVGTFQAVQHALANSFVAMEGSYSVTLHAAWAADALAPGDARAAAAVAKAYCSRAARPVCETAIQVHGGIGNTWDCAAHLYLRRALLSSRLLGGAGASLAHVLSRHEIGGTLDGLR
jgi:alkylation response protein AidB-like acyl-CoA dehydrogenase